MHSRRGGALVCIIFERSIDSCLEGKDDTFSFASDGVSALKATTEACVAKN